MNRILPTLLLTTTIAAGVVAPKGQKIKVTRYDASGKHAYGYAYGHCALLAPGAPASGSPAGATRSASARPRPGPAARR